ncbi:MAG: hypothetical protein WD872_20520, partial [Pirellulaceae bacterium]
MMLRTTASSDARSTPAMPRQIADGMTPVPSSVFSITACRTFSSASSPAPCRFAPSSRPSAMMRSSASASRQTVLVPPTSMPRTGITDILPFMIVLSGADLVLPGGVQSAGTLV